MVPVAEIDRDRGLTYARPLLLPGGASSGPARSHLRCAARARRAAAGETHRAPENGTSVRLTLRPSKSPIIGCERGGDCTRACCARL